MILQNINFAEKMALRSLQREFVDDDDDVDNNNNNNVCSFPLMSFLWLTFKIIRFKTMFFEMLWNYKSFYFLDFLFSRSPLCVIESTLKKREISRVN